MNPKLRTFKKIASLNPTRYENKYMHNVRDGYIEYIKNVFDCMESRNRILKVKSLKEWLLTEI